jgi:hypothetical protein
MATFVIGRYAGDLSAGLPRAIRLGQFLIAAGVNAKALSTYMGHASIKTTLDRYGHLMPGNEAEAEALLDTYLERSARRSLRSDALWGSAWGSRQRSGAASSGFRTSPSLPHGCSCATPEAETWLEKVSGRRGSNPRPSAWEAEGLWLWGAGFGVDATGMRP